MIFSLFVGTLALGLLMAPGWLLAARRRIPWPALVGFIGGAVFLENIVLLLDATGLGLSLRTLGVAWGAVLIAAVVAARHRGPAGAAFGPAPGWRENWMFWLPIIPVLAAVSYRAIAHPLFGVDTFFRWNRLATLMFTQHTLAFYPPVTPADYAQYAWPDGIPPTVSTLYLGAYLVAGAIRPQVTAPIVLAQYLLLLVAVYALARREFGARAGAFACVLVAGTPMIAWATCMGQETGLTALSLTALLYYLPHDRQEERPGLVVAAALAAGLGALAREYALVFPLLGLGVGLARRLSLRSLTLFATVALAVVAPWYLRNWVRTGNPLFNHPLTGWFPVNEAQVVLIQTYREIYGIARQWNANWGSLPCNCWAALGGGFLGALWHFRQARALVLSAGVVIGLWVLSVSYTGAGFTSSLRVLSPALALGAVLGGAVCARWIPGRRLLAGAILALTFVGFDSALRALVLPADPYRMRPAAWFQADHFLEVYRHRPLYREIALRAAGSRVLVHSLHTELATQGARVVPVWSPDVAFLFDPQVGFDAAARRLRALGIDYVAVQTDWINQRYLMKSRFFREAPAARLHLLVDTGDLEFFVILPDTP